MPTAQRSPQLLNRCALANTPSTPTTNTPEEPQRLTPQLTPQRQNPLPMRSPQRFSDPSHPHTSHPLSALRNLISPQGVFLRAALRSAILSPSLASQLSPARCAFPPSPITPPPPQLTPPQLTPLDSLSRSHNPSHSSHSSHSSHPSFPPHHSSQLIR